MSAAEKSKLEQVQVALAQLRNSFLNELAEHCAKLEHELLALRDSESFSESYDTLYRSFHSLKGSAGTHGIPLISAACHEIEDALSAIKQFQPDVINKFITYALSNIDVIQKITDQVTNEDISVLQKQLETNRNRYYTQQRTGMIAMGSSLMSSVCKEALSDFPLQLITVDNGLTAIERLMNLRYDLLIISGELKFLNGMSITYALRASGSVNKNIKIVYLTSANQTKFAKDLAPDAIVQKDQDFAGQLERIVGELLFQR